MLVHYIFLARHNDTWTKAIIIRQDYLFAYFENNKLGTVFKEKLNLYFSYTGSRVECSGQDFSKYIGDYSDFPVIEH